MSSIGSPNLGTQCPFEWRSDTRGGQVDFCGLCGLARLHIFPGSSELTLGKDLHNPIFSGFKVYVIRFVLSSNIKLSSEFGPLFRRVHAKQMT